MNCNLPKNEILELDSLTPDIENATIEDSVTILQKDGLRS